MSCKYSSHSIFMYELCMWNSYQYLTLASVPISTFAWLSTTTFDCFYYIAHLYIYIYIYYHRLNCYGSCTSLVKDPIVGVGSGEWQCHLLCYILKKSFCSKGVCACVGWGCCLGAIRWWVSAFTHIAYVCEWRGWYIVF